MMITLMTRLTMVTMMKMMTIAVFNDSSENEFLFVFVC